MEDNFCMTFEEGAKNKRIKKNNGGIMLNSNKHRMICFIL